MKHCDCPCIVILDSPAQKLSESLLNGNSATRSVLVNSGVNSYSISDVDPFNRFLSLRQHGSTSGHFGGSCLKECDEIQRKGLTRC